MNASYAASSVLAKQIEAGAPAEVFFSADRAWVEYLEARGLLERGSPREVLGNALVLIAPADSPLHLNIAPGFDLTAALGAGRLAMADPDSVPAGKYARAALTKLGVWPRVSDRLVRGENVRAALAYVARGEAPLGIVYGSDALAEKRVRVIGMFPEDTHPPITYVLALSARPEAARFAEFLAGETARQIFARYGFIPLAVPGRPLARRLLRSARASHFLTESRPFATMGNALPDSWRHSRCGDDSHQVRHSGNRAPAEALRARAVAQAQGHCRNQALPLRGGDALWPKQQSGS